MALAIRFDKLIRDGLVTDQAELARLGHVTWARLTQIMILLHLAPDIQEAILCLPRVERGKDPIQEKQLRPTRLAKATATVGAVVKTHNWNAALVEYHQVKPIF